MTNHSTTPTKKKPRIIDIINNKIASNERFFSFEYYPPKTEKTVAELKERLFRMHKWGPQWMDITWGAGGTTSDLTPEISNHILNNVSNNCLMHLTCTNMAKEKVDIALNKGKQMGLANILALRGDPPKGAKEWKAIAGGFTCALDLIKYIKSQPQFADEFGIVVSGYPEGHPLVRKPITDKNWDAKTNTPKYWAVNQLDDGSYEGVSPADWKNELAYLKQKITAGGEVIITQLFYDAQVFIDYVHAVRAAGITAPVMPGIMPILSYGMFHRMIGFCKTVLPKKLNDGLLELKDKPKEVYAFGIDWMVKLCTRLLNCKLDGTDFNLIPGIHIYTMNSERASIDLLKRLGFGDPLLIQKEHARVMKEYEQKLLLRKLSPKKKRSPTKKKPMIKLPFQAMNTF